MTINAVDKEVLLSWENGNRRGLSDLTDYPYLVYPISENGIFSNDTIPNTLARWRILASDSSERWQWFDGGGYIFDASGASTGSYSAVYEVRDWDGEGNNATATVTVAVT